MIILILMFLAFICVSISLILQNKRIDAHMKDVEKELLETSNITK